MISINRVGSGVAKQRNLNCGGSTVFVVSMDQDLEIQDGQWISTSLYPLLKYMKIWGMFFDVPSRQKKTCSGSLDKYVLVVTILVWMNVIRMLTCFNKDDTLGPKLFWKLSLFMWMFACAAIQTIFYYACKTEILQRVFQELDSFKDFSVVVQRDVAKGCKLFWLMSTVNVAVVLLAYGTGNEMFEVTIAPLGGLIPVDHWVNYFAKGCYLIIHLFLTSKTQLSSNLRHILTVCIQLQLDNTDGKIISALTTGTETCSLKTFENLRLERQRLVHLVGDIDSLMSILNGVGVVCSCCDIVLQLYNMVWYYSSVNDLTMVFSWVFFSLLAIRGLAITAVGGLRVNIAVSTKNVQRQLFFSPSHIQLTSKYQI